MALTIAATAKVVGAQQTIYARYDDLPAPAHRTDLNAAQLLQLEIIVNGLNSGVVAQVVKRGSSFELTVEDLRRAGLRLELTSKTVDLDSLEGLHADYDQLQQQLHLTVLPQYLPMQRLGARDSQFQPARRDIGALLNYDLYANAGQGKLFASLWHEARAFGRAGVFSTTGVWRNGGGYDRFDTYWRLSDERTMITAEAGDIITRTLPWTPAIRLGGFQLSRDFSIRPDVITYPLPEFAGSASLPSNVELLLDGQRIAGSRVNPGPFALETLPPLNGHGEANLIVTDMQGRSVATAVPFYISTALLRPGVTDYSIAAGVIRRSYGRSSFDYRGFATTASARHGISDALTVEMRAEIADDLRLAGGGGVARIGHFGTLSASYSFSGSERGEGGQLTVGYEYQARLFSLGLRHSRSDEDYVDLGRLDRREHGWERLTTASASVSMGGAGTLGIGYFDMRQQRGRDARLANASWTVPLGSGSRLYASVSHEFEDSSWSGGLTLSIPLGQASLSAGAMRSRTGTMGLRADYSSPLPSAGGFGGSAGALSESGQRPYLRGDVAWRAQAIELRAGAYGHESATGWLGASGSIVIMDGAVFAANRVADAFAIVSAGEAGIPVRYENQLIGTTDAKGRLFVPSASAYYPARYDLDTLALPTNVKAQAVSQQVAVAAGSGHVVRFNIQRMRAARARVMLKSGEPVPAGANATINGGQTTYVGWNGLLFMEHVAVDNLIQVELPDGGTCQTAFSADPDAARDTILNLGALTCGQ